MTTARLAILWLTVVLAPSVAAGPARRDSGLPHTGLAVDGQLLGAGILGLLGAGLRRRSRPTALLRPEPVVPWRR